MRQLYSSVVTSEALLTSCKAQMRKCGDAPRKRCPVFTLGFYRMVPLPQVLSLEEKNTNYAMFLLSIPLSGKNTLSL